MARDVKTLSTLPEWINNDLRRLAERVRRLTISRHDPHKFFEDRDDIGADIEVLADRIHGYR